VQLVPVAGQDEQGVVDRDGESQHQREDRRAGAEFEEPGGRRDTRHADPHTDRRVEQRQSGRHERTQGDQQDDGGHADAEDLAGARAATLLQGVAADLDREAGLPC
jgi:hypothetical protein